VLSTVDMVVQGRNASRRLHDNDDEDDDVIVWNYCLTFNHVSGGLYVSVRKLFSGARRQWLRQD